MKTLVEYIHESMNESDSIQESVVLTSLALALVCQPLFDSSFAKTLKSTFGSFFKNIQGKNKRNNDGREEKKEKKGKKEKEEKDNDDDDTLSIWRGLIGVAQENAGEKEKKLLNTVAACTVDGDGNDIDLSKVGQRVKEVTGQTTAEWGKANNVSQKLSDDDLSKATGQLRTAVKNKTPEELTQLTQKVAKNATTGNDDEKETIKDEEITDENGKKIKVQMHYGPRGGKYYWPEGSPKDDEHKVYVD